MGHQRVTSRRPAQQENIDKAPAIAQQFAVEAVPTLLVLNDYEVLGRQSGADRSAALRNSWSRCSCPPRWDADRQGYGTRRELALVLGLQAPQLQR
jgi:thioredoxin-like negative regulator of GroEL